MSLHFKKHVLSLLILLILYTGVASIYAIITPVFEKPDEYLHFAFAMYLHDTGDLPVQRLEQRDHKAGQQGSQPPLIYASVVAAWKLLGVDDPAAGFTALTRQNPHYNWSRTPWLDNENQFLRGACTDACAMTTRAALIGRGVGIFYGLIALVGAWLAVRLAFPRAPGLALLVVGAMGFLPQFLHIASSVSNDIPTVAMINLSFAAVVWWSQSPQSSGRVILLAIPVGLTALSKVSGLSVGLVMGLTLLLTGSLAWRVRVRQIAIFGMVVVSICGWWYWRNYDLYGDVTATQIHLDIYTDLAPPAPTLSRLMQDWLTVFKSFWASFGWKEINPGAIPQMIVAVLVALLLGRAVWLLWQADAINRVPTPSRPVGTAFMLSVPSTFLLSLCLLHLLLTGLTLTQWMREVDAPLGRLLFPALLPITLLLMLGVPCGWRGLWSGASAVIPIILALVLIQPAYQAPRPLFEINASEPLAVVGDHNLILRDVVWGEDDQWVYVQLTWEVGTPLTEDYQVFVHAREHPYWILSQRDTYPGLGHRLTSEMQAGQLFTEVYPLAKTPPQIITSFATGFYILTPDGGWTRLPIQSAVFEVADDALQLPMEQIRKGAKIR